jgi:hypothetical protein
VAGQIWSLVFGRKTGLVQEGGAHDAAEESEGGSAARRPDVSIREFLDESGALSIPEKIVVIGRYMVEHESSSDFTRDDIKSRFASARETVPANLSRDLGRAIEYGWAAEDPAKPGRFYVTRKGEDALRGRFSSDARKSGSQRRRASRKSKGASGAGDRDEQLNA